MKESKRRMELYSGLVLDKGDNTGFRLFCKRATKLIGLLISGIMGTHIAPAAMPVDGQAIHIYCGELEHYVSINEGSGHEAEIDAPNPYTYYQTFIVEDAGDGLFNLKSKGADLYLQKGDTKKLCDAKGTNPEADAARFTWVDLGGNEFKFKCEVNQDFVGYTGSKRSLITRFSQAEAPVFTWEDASDQKYGWRVLPEDPLYPAPDTILAFCSVTDPVYKLPDDPANKDCTAAFQMALDAADANGGGTVYVPPGHYRMDGRLQIDSNVTLRGRWREITASQPAIGSIIKVYYGLGDEDPNEERPLIKGGSIKDLTFWYPLQDPTNITPYPAVIGSLVTAKNITFVNAYKGLIMPTSSMCFINNVEGTVLKKGFFADISAAISRFENLNFGPEFWPWAQLGDGPVNPAYKEYMLSNTIGIDIRDMDGFYMADCKARGMKTGLLFAKADREGGNGPSGGFVSGLDLRDCVIGFDSQSKGANLLNSFIHGTDRGVLGNGSFNTCIIKGGNAAVENNGINAVNTTFDGIVNLPDGDVTLMNCTFLQSGTDLILGSSVDSIRMVGTRFADGPDIIDHSRDSIVKIMDPERDEDYLSAPPLPAIDLSISRKPYTTNFFSIADYGAIPNDRNDDTAAFAAAVAAANSNGGGIVFIPNGAFNVTGSHTFEPGVELRGTSGSLFGTDLHPSGNGKTGSLLLISGNEGNPDGPAFLNLTTDCGVRGLTLHYNKQKNEMLRAGTIIHYPYTIRATGDNIYVTDIQMTNPYRGIHFYRADNHLVDSCKFGNLNNTILVEECKNGRIGRFHIKPEFWRASEIRDIDGVLDTNHVDLDVYSGVYLTCIWMKNSTNEVAHSIFNHASHQFMRIENTSALCYMTACEEVQGGMSFSGDQDVQVVYGGPNVSNKGDHSGMWGYWAKEDFTGTAKLWAGFCAGTPGRLHLVESGTVVAQQVMGPTWSGRGNVNMEVCDGATLKLLMGNPNRKMGAILEPDSNIVLKDVRMGDLPNTILNHPGTVITRPRHKRDYISTSPNSGKQVNDGLVLDTTDLRIENYPLFTPANRAQWENPTGAITSNGTFKIDVVAPDFIDGKSKNV